MTCFGELFARYPKAVYDLLEQECFDDRRLYCVLPQPSDRQCFFCERHPFDDGAIEWNEVCRTCDDTQCRELWAWYGLSGRDGSRRRKAFKDVLGKTLWDVPHALRREALLTATLMFEAKEKANGGKPRLRMAA